MKATLITLVITIISSIGNMSSIQAKDTYYKSNELNPIGQVIKTTIYKGESETNLTHTKQLEYKYDDRGNLKERIFSVWDAKASKWIPTKKYQFNHTEEGQLQTLSYSIYNKSENEWTSKKRFVMYIYDIEGKLVATQYLNIKDKKDQIFASNFRSK